VLNTIVAEAIDELAAKLEQLTGDGTSVDEAVVQVVRDVYAASKQIVFGGDNYTEEWEAEASGAAWPTCTRRPTRCS
jgi:glutamine synthetase